MSIGDRNCRELAARQCGVLSRSQAKSCGLTARAIDRRVARGEFLLVHPGVYLIAGAAPSWRRDLWAAFLGAGPAAAISHRSAGALWGFEGLAEGIVELTSTSRQVSERVIQHRKRLARLDVEILDGLRVTSPARTLLDLADVLGARRVERAFHDALHRELVSVSGMRALLRRSGGRGVRGCTLIRELLASTDSVDTRSQTTFERRLGRVIRESSLPAAVPQFEIYDEDGFVTRPDFAYPKERLAIEADSYQFHGNKLAWANDLDKRTRLASAGWHVLAFTWADVHERPDYVIHRIRRALAIQRRKASPD